MNSLVNEKLLSEVTAKIKEVTTSSWSVYFDESVENFEKLCKIWQNNVTAVIEITKLGDENNMKALSKLANESLDSLISAYGKKDFNKATTGFCLIFSNAKIQMISKNYLKLIHEKLINYTDENDLYVIPILNYATLNGTSLDQELIDTLCDLVFQIKDEIILAVCMKTILNIHDIQNVNCEKIIKEIYNKYLLGSTNKEKQFTFVLYLVSLFKNLEFEIDETKDPMKNLVSLIKEHPKWLISFNGIIALSTLIRFFKKNNKIEFANKILLLQTEIFMQKDQNEINKYAILLIFDYWKRELNELLPLETIKAILEDAKKCNKKLVLELCVLQTQIKDVKTDVDPEFIKWVETLLKENDLALVDTVIEFLYHSCKAEIKISEEGLDYVFEMVKLAALPLRKEWCLYIILECLKHFMMIKENRVEELSSMTQDENEKIANLAQECIELYVENLSLNDHQNK